MAQFPHLAFPKRVDGLHKPRRGRSGELDPETQARLSDRQGHGSTLLRNVDALSQDWRNNIAARVAENLPALPNPGVVPIFLQIDAKKFDVESLKGFGIEIIAEEEGGFIIGAATDDFQSLRAKIEKFMAAEGNYKNKAAELWSIDEGHQWRIEQILSSDLRDKWNTITDDQILVVDVGIACYVRMSDQPTPAPDDTEAVFQKRLTDWKAKKVLNEQRREEIAMARQTEFEALVSAYNGEALSGFIDFDDSFSCRIRISGKGLKDIVLNYQYLFEVVEHDPLVIQGGPEGGMESPAPDLLPPPEGSPKVCVIDSGIQEEHRLLAAAIDTSTSASFIPGDISTADVASNGGHGTKVAGAVLYPYQIPNTGQYQLPCFIQNARVLANLGGQPRLPENVYPPQLMEDIAAHFDGTRIFNMSINYSNACRLVHMSQWGAAIDKLMYAKNVLFVLSAGNLRISSGDALRPGIREHLTANRNYPAFLLEKSSRIGDPAQSCFALTVGSVCFEKFDDGPRESFGERDQPSPFSRTGLGLWGMIKPDVVEYAGDLAREKTGTNITHEPSIAPKLVRSTYGGGSEVGTDDVGTSFAAPKVSYIAAILQKMYPQESTNLYRSLIAQSARLPSAIFANPSFDNIRHYGYGIPDLKRATENSEQRITLIASGDLAAKQAYVYPIKVPAQMRTPGEDYDILVEVSLSFMARPRRTRRGTHSYLSTWLDWDSSKLNENHTQFVQRVLKDMEEPENEPEDQDTIKWVIREKNNWSKITGLKRQDSTLQKSWCVIKSNQLPEVLSLAVIGHAGWEADLSERVPYSIAVSFEALNANINVYEMIRVENEIEIPVEVEQEVRF